MSIETPLYNSAEIYARRAEEELSRNPETGAAVAQVYATLAVAAATERTAEILAFNADHRR